MDVGFQSPHTGLPTIVHVTDDPRRDDPGPLTTPDGRYLVVRGRLWRKSDPALPEHRRSELVAELMSARRAKRDAMAADDRDAREVARSRVDAAKVGLGERGPVWWSDDQPDLTRHLVRTTRYATWFAATAGADPDADEAR
jgi:hypothetical protein